MKKIKHWKAILFPCLGVAGFAAVAVPAAIIGSGYKVTAKYEGQRWSIITQAGKNQIEYQFHTTYDVDFSKERIDLEIREVKFTDSKCNIKAIGPITWKNNREFSQVVQLEREDGKPLEVKDQICFDVIIKSKTLNSNNVIWTTKFLNWNLVYNPEEK